MSALLIVVPGPDMALVARNAIGGGRRAALLTALGVTAGILVWTLAASLGLAALLRASEPAFLALRVVGAAYLIFLGLQALRSAVLGARAAEGDTEPGRVEIRRGHAFRQGFVANLANPKIAVFFTSFLPQFVPAGAPPFLALLLLGMVFCLMGLAWLTCYALILAKAGEALRRPRARRILDAITGTVLVTFGLRLASEQT